MIYLIFTYVDSVTRVPVSEAVSRNGPASPGVDGLTFGFALESQYPTDAPTFYGTAPDEAHVDVPGVIAVVSEADYNLAFETETDARKVRLAKQFESDISGRRYTAEVGGFAWGGFLIDTERDSQAKINSAWSAARDGFRSDGSVWKCFDLTAQQIVSRPTSNDEMIDIGRKSFLYVQGCYDREGELLAALADGTFTTEMLELGWPSQQ